jgi:hypothetical protein
VHAVLIACAIALSYAGVSARGPVKAPKWTHYVNARWGFCVDYPAVWKASEPKDGSCIDLYPYPGENSGSTTYISISGVPDQPDIGNANIVLDDSPPLDLEGNFARTIESLREYDHASDIRVLEKRKLEFQGYDALRTKFLYRNRAISQAGAGVTQWANETLWINKEYVIFTATLFGQPDQVRRLEPVYRDIVMHRFHLVCPAKR